MAVQATGVAGAPGVASPAGGAATDASTEAAAPRTLPEPTWQELKANWATKLLRLGPAPRNGAPPVAPGGVRRVRYPSPVGELPGWLVWPSSEGARVPVVVFAHADFTFDGKEMDAAVPFLQQRIAVFFPTWRGERDNPGSFEMFLGEVDDLAAAVQAAALIPGADPSQIYVIGHGAGGQLAALLSLHDDVKVAGTASVGALFRTEDLLYWRKVAPFDADDAVELRMRLLYPNLADMKLSHIAYVGEDDTTSGKAVHAFTAEGRRFGAPLRVVTVKGDETTSLRPALMQFIDAVKNADFPQRGYAAASDPASAEP